MRLFEVFSFSLSTITRSRGQPAAGESWVVRHEFTWKVGKNLKWIEKNSQKQPSNIYWMIIIVNHLLIWLFSQASSGCHLVESAANEEYYFVSLLKLAIFRDQGHIREVVVVRQASQRNPQLLYLLLDLSSCCSCFPRSFSPKAQQTTSLSIYLFTNLTLLLPMLAPVSSSSSHLLSSSLGPYGARQVNARIVDERLRIDWWEACFYSYFVKILVPKIKSLKIALFSHSLPAGFGFIAPPSL